MASAQVKRDEEQAMDTEQGETQKAGEVRADDHVAAVHHARTRGLPLLAVGIAGLLGSMLLLLRVGDLRASPRESVLLLLAAGLGHALACYGLRACWSDLSDHGRKAVVLGILLLAAALRVLAFGLPPTLSDDVYRYRWDGRVQAAGHNPYAEPPAAADLASLRDADWQRINYPRIRTIYPPLAQGLFAITYAIDDSVTAFRAAATVGDVLCVLLLLACLNAWRMPLWLLALYAWHPLPAIEFASSGHFDAWVMGAVLATVLTHRQGRQALSTVLLAAAVLLKTWPLILAPLLLRRRPRWHVVLLAAIIAAGYTPYLNAGSRILQPWLDYTGRWRFNDAAFFVLEAMSGSLELGKALAAGLGLGMLGWLWRRDAGPLAGGYWLLLAFILLMPTIHPWYLLWALPLAALSGDLGWVLLCGLAPTAYWVLVGAGGDSNLWVEPLWPRFVEYVPAAAVWLWQARRFGAPRPGRTPPPLRTGGVGG